MVAPPVDINYIAVVGGAVVSMILGFLWYGPLFSKPWMKAKGWTQEQGKQAAKGAGPGYALVFVGALVLSFIMAHVVDYANATTVVEGAETGFWMWLGFVLPVSGGTALFEGRPTPLFAINAGYHLVEFLAIAILLTLYV